MMPAKPPSCSQRRRCNVQRSVTAIVLFAAALLPQFALAQATITVAGNGQYEYNTNVFDLQHDYPVPNSVPLTYTHGDSYYAYGGELDLGYQWSQQRFFANITDTEYRYHRFLGLNHDAYKLDGGWTGTIGRTFDGSFDVMRSRTMVSYTDVTDFGALALMTEQRETGGVGFQFLPEWRVEAKGYYRTVDEPLPPQEPYLKLTENDAEGVIKYTGRAGLTAGLSLSYLHGDYTGSIGQQNPSYKQGNADLVANYMASGVSTFIGEVGYSRRSSASDLNNVAGVTGQISYINQLTGKTSIDLELSRAISPFINNGGSQITTMAAVNLTWQATYKITVMPGYDFTYAELPYQNVTFANGGISYENRIDHLQYASFQIKYQPVQWLSLNPYVHMQTRSSNTIGDNFTGTVYGMNVALQWERGAAQTTLAQPLQVR